jgi:predicted PurR-regulated permease PerM
VLLGVAVSQEALNLYNRIQDGSVDLQQYVTRINPLLRDLSLRLGIEPGSIQQRIYQAAGVAAQTVATQAVVVGQNLLSVVAKTALMLYLLFFFLRDGDSLLSVLGDAIPMGDGRQRTLFSRFASVTRATLKGSLLIGLVQGALGGLLFLVLGLRAPVFWGVIMAMLSLLPLVGPAIVWAPAAIFLMLTGSITKGIILIVGGVVVVGTADNVLRPLFVGRETRMPDYMVLLSTLGGLSVFGPAGFVAGPVIAALFLSVWDMFAREQRAVVLASAEPPTSLEEP